MVKETNLILLEDPSTVYMRKYNLYQWHLEWRVTTGLAGAWFNHCVIPRKGSVPQLLNLGLTWVQMEELRNLLDEILLEKPKEQGEEVQESEVPTVKFPGGVA